MKTTKMSSIFLIILCLCSCQAKEEPKKEIVKGDLQHTIFIVSDTHLFSKNLISETNKIYTKENIVSDGRIQHYDYQLLEKMVEIVNVQKPNVFMITGDITYNGEKDSHIEVANILNKVNNETKVLVIPGNHDCLSVSSISIINDDVELTESVTFEEFKEIYSDFGYSDAYSYDKDSLSYIYPIDSDTWLIMLDTNLSEYNEDNGSNMTLGSLDQSTIDWLEENLKYAQANNIEVISATHHNIDVHNEMFKSSYTLFNYITVSNMLRSYGVKINFSGHLHIQSIKENQGLYDIASNSLLAYGNRYGVLDIYQNCYEYNAKKLDFIDENIDLEQISFNNFYNKYYEKSISTFQRYLKKYINKATELVSKANCFYFDGNYKKIKELRTKSKKVYNEIKKNYVNYEKSYIHTILDVPNQNNHYLIIQK